MKKGKKAEIKNIGNRGEKNIKNNHVILSKKILKKTRKKQKQYKKYKLNNSNNKSSKLGLKKKEKLKINDNYEEYNAKEANKVTEIIDNKNE